LNKYTFTSDKEPDEVYTKNQDEDVTLHKKRRKKNVESKDSWTQTERSDYMLIKQKIMAKQKQIMQII
jgi:hypothetical protein